jgi:hypothetical protein
MESATQGNNTRDSSGMGERRNLKSDESGHLKTEITKSQIGPANRRIDPSNLTFCNFGFEMPGFVQFQISPAFGKPSTLLLTHAHPRGSLR